MKRGSRRGPPPAGGRPPWRGALSRALRDGVRGYQQLRRRFVGEATASGLHALRIEARRLLALLAFATELSARVGSDAEKICRELKRSLRATAAARDVDVLLVAVDEMLPEYPELKKFRGHLRRRRLRAIERAQRRLRRRRRKLRRRVHALAAELAAPITAGSRTDAVQRALQSAADDVRDSSRAARRDEARVHRARIAVKRLRYMLEALGDLLSKAERSSVEELRRLQRVMGEINDLDVLDARIAKYTAQRPREHRRLRRARAAIVRRRRQRWRQLELHPPSMRERRPLGRSRARTSPANYAGQ